MIFIEPFQNERSFSFFSRLSHFQTIITECIVKRPTIVCKFKKYCKGQVRIQDEALN